MIIGLTGRNGAGKGAVADFLVGSGFLYYSLSDVLRDQLRKQGLEVTREELIRIGRQLRAQNGPGYLAEVILGRLDPDTSTVVDSFRTPDEVTYFRRLPNFVLFSIQAKGSIRFERLASRAREGDPETRESFLNLEKQELSGKRAEDQQVDRCEKLADFTIENNGSREDLQTRLLEVLDQLGHRLEI